MWLTSFSGLGLRVGGVSQVDTFSFNDTHNVIIQYPPKFSYSLSSHYNNLDTFRYSLHALVIVEAQFLHRSQTQLYFQ